MNNRSTWQQKVEDTLVELESEKETQAEGVYRLLFSVDSLAEFDDRNCINILGLLHDTSDILQRREGYQKVVDLGEDLLSRNLESHDEAQLNYTIANARTGLMRIDGELTSYQWESENHEEIIRRLRKSLDLGGAKKLPNIQLQRAYINLGNSLSNIGRWIEALDNWRIAAEIDDSYSPPKGQIGFALVHYAQFAPRHFERLMLLKRAHECLLEALNSDDLHSQMRSAFASKVGQIESNVNTHILTIDVEFDTWSLGEGEEKKYREWVLKNRLSLNLLNDITTESGAANDNLHIQQLLDKNTEKSRNCLWMFNNLKQEFITARYQLWDSLSGMQRHYSSKGVRLASTGGTPLYSKNIETLKFAFRSAYSIFDKIASFLDYYFDLGYIPQYQLHFDKVWYKNPNKSQLAPEFDQKPNLPLRGLFWLSKDLEYDSSLSVQKSLEPGAERLRKLRNNLEHGFAYVDSELSINGEKNLSFPTFVQEVDASQLHEDCMSLIKKARAAIIYLTLSINVEEHEIGI